MSNIHATAIVEEGAKLADSVVVGPYAFIGKNVVIGDGTTVGHNAHIDGHTTIGKNNKIFPHTAIGTAPQDLKYNGEPTRLEIGDGNTFREFCQVNTGTVHGGSLTKIGNNCLIMGHTHIAHDDIIGNNCIVANFAVLAGHVELGDNVIVGGSTAVHQFVKIGSYTMVGGASAVSQDLPPFSLAEGNRAVIRGLNLVGLRRALSREVIDSIKPVFKQLFRGGVSPKTVAEALIKEDLSKEARELCQFVIDSKRGIPVLKQHEEDDN